MNVLNLLVNKYYLLTIKYKKRIVWSCFFILISLITSILTFKILDVSYPLPEIEKLKKFSQLVVDRNGRPLRAFADSQGVWRYPTDYKSVSTEYLTALINYEDRKFWSHGGVNYLSILRAIKQLVMNGRTISGGSTLTMQVARIIDPHSKTVAGKLWQIFRAYQLEHHLSKFEILNMYLNYAPFGGPIEGIEAATYTYLGKSAAELTTSESALMAVLPQSPSRFRPDRFPMRAERARNKVLKRMQTFSVWNEEKVKAALLDPVIAEFNSRPLIAPLLARQLASKNKGQSILNSTIDLDIQLDVADRVKDYLTRFSERTSASALLMDNQSLEVIAYVGTADFGNKKRFGHLDMNRAIRSPGSTLKPFIYAMAMDEKLIHSQSLLQDVPLAFGSYDAQSNLGSKSSRSSLSNHSSDPNLYRPENFNRSYSGPVSVSEALQKSLNIPAVQVLSHLGAEKFSAKLQNAGLSLYLPKGAEPSLSLALGGAGVKLIDLVSVYRSFVAGGLAGKPRYLLSAPKEERYLLSKESAWIIGEILAEVPLLSKQKSSFFKTTKHWVAHKTGTSYGHRDAWMIAVTQKYTLAVWIGKPDGTPSPGEFGRKTAAPLISKILSVLPKTNLDSVTQQHMPEKVTLNNICWPLGLTTSMTKAEHCHQKKQAYLIKSTAPQTLTQDNYISPNPITIHVASENSQRVFSTCYSGIRTAKEIALWPSRLDYWLPKEFQKKTLMPAVSLECQKSLDLVEDLVIVGIERNGKVINSPDNLENLELNLSVLASQDELTWIVNGKKVGQTKSEEPMLLTNLASGNYSVLVFNRQGQKGEVEFNVL